MALIQSLGDVPKDSWPSDLRAEVVRSLDGLYRDDPDAGVHGAAKWLLLQWDLGADIKRIDDELARNQNVAPGFQWRISREGLTLVTVDDLMVDRVFEVSDTEITVEVYRRFDRDVVYATEISPVPACPINGVSYYEAAAFCNWLSVREGIPESEACYQQLKPEVGTDGLAYEPVSGYRNRGGFRLPDNTEFAAFCAAGTTTTRYCGDSDILFGATPGLGSTPLAGRIPSQVEFLTTWVSSIRLETSLSGASAMPVKLRGLVRADLRGGWFGHIPATRLSRSTVVEQVLGNYRDPTQSVRVVRTKSVPKALNRFVTCMN